ncbi:branched-chain amino acid transaminase [Spirillospora sp. CA-294931]|uniref:branched-chain amino acid transaminase n=1 Tax=Spirillospora sp. CA-294931 TaxID=3240042 RepID=UPI003D9423BD
MTAKIIWMDGELVDRDAATVHVTSYGLHYGIGFFEGLRCHPTPEGPAVFRLTDHLVRLRRSAAVYGIPLPYPVEEMARACRAVVSANGLTECYLRPIVFLGDGPDPLSAPYRAAIVASEDGPLIGPPKTDGARAMISGLRRMSADSIPPAAKATGQYLNSFLAQSEALRAGYDEAILLNAAGFVTDGWAHNLFALAGGELRTPPVSAGALPGITRDSVMTLAREDGLPVSERDLVRTDLYLADECFLTGTAAGVVPVVSVDGRPVGAGTPGPVTARLAAALADVASGTSGAHPEWRETVS